MRFHLFRRATRRIEPVRVNQTLSNKSAAAAYVAQIKELRKKLRAIRAKYKAAKTPLEKAHYEVEFNATAHFPDPIYPSSKVIKYIGIKDKWMILATATLIRRGLHGKRFIEEHFDKFAALEKAPYFKFAINQILNPPIYPFWENDSPPSTAEPVYPPVRMPENSPPPPPLNTPPPEPGATRLPGYSPPPLYRGGIRRTRKNKKKGKKTYKNRKRPQRHKTRK